MLPWVVANVAGTKKESMFSRNLRGGRWYSVLGAVRGEDYPAEAAVLLIVYYIVFMVLGDIAAYFIGLFIEYEWGPQVSLIAFLALYFMSLWLAWVLSVYFTRPKTAAAA